MCRRVIADSRDADATENEIAVSDLDRIEKKKKAAHGAGKMEAHPMGGGAVAQDFKKSAMHDGAASIAAAYGPGGNATKSNPVPFSNSKDNLLGNFTAKLAETTAALDALTKKANGAATGISILKAPPTL